MACRDDELELSPRQIQFAGDLLQRCLALRLDFGFVEVEQHICVNRDLLGHGHEDVPLRVHWMDLAAALGLGGLWLFLFARQARTPREVYGRTMSIPGGL